MIQELPDELLLEIAFLLQDKIGNDTDDLLALCKVSKALARTAQEVLFQDCYIGGTLAPKRLGLFLRTILNRTDLARKVRKLEVTVTQHYAWTRTHPSWINMDGTTTDTFAFLSNCVRDLKLPVYDYMEHTWLRQLRIRAHNSHIAVVALVLARVRQLRSLHLILADYLEMPPLLVQLCSMHPSLMRFRRYPHYPWERYFLTPPGRGAAIASFAISAFGPSRRYEQLSHVGHKPSPCGNLNYHVSYFTWKSQWANTKVLHCAPIVHVPLQVQLQPRKCAFCLGESTKHIGNP